MRHYVLYETTKCGCKCDNTSWLRKNWFGLTVATCTVVVSIIQVVATLLSIGWLEFLWKLHENSGI